MTLKIQEQISDCRFTVELIFPDMRCQERNSRVGLVVLLIRVIILGCVDDHVNLRWEDRMQSNNSVASADETARLCACNVVSSQACSKSCQRMIVLCFEEYLIGGKVFLLAKLETRMLSFITTIFHPDHWTHLGAFLQKWDNVR